MAEEDCKRIITAKELNESRDQLNQVRIEDGEEPYIDEEYPLATKDIISYTYAGPALSQISDAYNRGKILKKGSAVW